MQEIIKKHSYKILWLAILLYSLFFIFLSLKKYYNFDYNGLDLTIFNQVFFNTANGRWFEMTFNLNNYLADHFTPIIILLLPIYKIWPRPENLLILQSIILSLCAWPLYMITQKVIGNKLISLGVGLLWLINFLLHNGNLFEFHLLPFAVFFILWTFYFYYKYNFKLFLLFFVLTLLVREDMSLILLGFSVLSIIDKRNKKWIISSGLSIIYFLLALKIISFFNLGEENKFLLYYNWLGGNSLISISLAWLSHPVQFLGHLFRFSNIISLFIIFISVGFLPLLAPRYLWLLFFPLLQFALTGQGISNIVYSIHYVLIFLPGLFIATIFGIKNIIKNQKIIFKNKKLFIILFIFTVFYFSIFLSPIKNILFNSYQSNFKESRQNFIAQIPQDASLVVSAGLAAPLSNREDIYLFQYSYFGRTQFYLADFVFPEVDYILVDMKDMFNILSFVKKREDLFAKKIKHIRIPEDFRKRLDNYRLIKAEDNLLLWKHKNLIEQQELLDLYKVEKKSLNFDNSNFVVSSEYLKQANYNILNITYQKTQEEKNYLVRFYSDDNYFDLPIDYGLWPPRDWSKDSLVSFYYYLNQDVKSYQIFSWQGDTIIGNNREVKLDMILTEESKRKDINL